MSKIEWTDETWNPVAGCTWASPGCDHCYAARMARRLEAMGQADYAGLTTRKHFNGVVRMLEHKLSIPLRWKKPRMVFVNSMSDLFHPAVPFEFVDRVFAAMALAGQHTFQVLTKRPDRMAEYCDFNQMREDYIYQAMESIAEKHGIADFLFDALPLPNVWIGTSAEDQQRADERREPLRACPAAVRFVSYEPALGPVDWTGWEFVDQIIAGGESGPNARASHPGWHRGARDFCQANGIAFFFKQWGAWIGGGCNSFTDDVYAMLEKGVARRDWPDGVQSFRVGKKIAGRVIDGLEWNEFPQTEGSRNVGAVT